MYVYKFLNGGDCAPDDGWGEEDEEVYTHISIYIFFYIYVYMYICIHMYINVIVL
jgi:hypothetical protein